MGKRKRGNAKAVLLAVVILMTNCTQGRKLADRTGAEIFVGPSVERVISMAPSNTEIIVDLGRAEKLVAVDRHSSDIDGLPDGIVFMDFFYPDAEAILALKPDLIIANGHNATGTGDDPFRLLREMGIPVAYISMSRSIDDIYKDITFVASLLDAEEAGVRLVRAMKSGVEEIAAHAPAGGRTSVYFEISPMPQMFTFGKNSFIDDMITTVGARNIFGDENWLVSPSAEAIIERNPDVILTNVNYIDDPVAEIQSRAGFEHINAVINKRIYRIDNNASVRASARIVSALRQMARAIYPEFYAK